ncbi:MAG: ABC transporter permease subunit [Nocardiopsaceae bacterium]|nr:ABC transporter permease subunit [Nocardiopsaceae bacterium]
MTTQSTSWDETVPLPQGGTFLAHGGALRRALSYEWVAMRSIRAPWLLCGAALVAQILTDAFEGRSAMAGNGQLASGMLGVILAGFTLFAALGVTVIGGEYRHHTITTTVLTLSDRRGILLAKAVVTAAVTAVTAAVMVLVNAFSVPVLGGVPVSASRVAGLGAAAVLYAVLCALAGLAVGALTRNPALSIALAILWPAVLEKVAILALHVSQDLAPFTAAAAQAEARDGGPQWALTLPLAALVAVLLALASTLFCRRDV